MIFRPRALVAVAFLFAVPLHAHTVASNASKPLAFEISYSKALSPSPVDGHVLLIISKEEEPRGPGFGVVEGIDSQQAFGVDVDGLQPGGIVRIDGSTLGYPLESLSQLVPGEYTVRAVLNLQIGIAQLRRHATFTQSGAALFGEIEREVGSLATTMRTLHLSANAPAVTVARADGRIVPLSIGKDGPAISILDSVKAHAEKFDTRRQCDLRAILNLV